MNKRILIGVLLGLAAVGGVGVILLARQGYFINPATSPTPVFTPSASPLPTSTTSILPGEQQRLNTVLNVSGSDAAKLVLLNKGISVWYKGVVTSISETGTLIGLNPVTQEGGIARNITFSADLSACGNADLGIGGVEAVPGSAENLQRFIPSVRVGGEMMFVCGGQDFDLTTLTCGRFKVCATLKTCDACSKQ